MKVLWITNVSLPESSKLINEKSSPFGGWLVYASKALSNKCNVELSVAFPSLNFNNVKKLKGQKIIYFAFPNISIKKRELIDNNINLKFILEEVQPDLVHVFGTECAHSLAMINVCKEFGIPTIISIQGLISYISKHYSANLPINVQKKYTFRDFIKQNNILQQKKEFEKRGLLEIEAIRKTDHIIGRTTWDRACTSQINPNAKYHHCDETLREEFYQHQWSIEKCEKYSIFLSQASYPIKGLHYVLQALPIILKKFPETKLYIAGHDITASSNLKERLKQTSYAKYIGEIVSKYSLREHVFFTGILDERQMCKRYLKSHVFVCPSSIENSPNSLGEAMILGVPCVASDVGGVSDMLKHKEEGFVYQTDAPYMLAHYVCEIFKNDGLALEFSREAREHALKTHDPSTNTNRLLEIYNDILQKKE